MSIKATLIIKTSSGVEITLSDVEANELYEELKTFFEKPLQISPFFNYPPNTRNIYPKWGDNQKPFGDGKISCEYTIPIDKK